MDAFSDAGSTPAASTNKKDDMFRHVVFFIVERELSRFSPPEKRLTFFGAYDITKLS